MVMCDFIIRAFNDNVCKYDLTNNISALGISVFQFDFHHLHGLDTTKRQNSLKAIDLCPPPSFHNFKKRWKKSIKGKRGIYWTHWFSFTLVQHKEVNHLLHRDEERKEGIGHTERDGQDKSRALLPLVKKLMKFISIESQENKSSNFCSEINHCEFACADMVKF